MLAALEAEGLLPRPPITIKVVDRATVRAILEAERALCQRAIELGLYEHDIHLGFASYIGEVTRHLDDKDRIEFDRIFAEESFSDEDLAKAEASLAAAEASLAEAQKQYTESSTPSSQPSTARVFMAGVNATILIGCALFWIFK